MFTVTTRNTLLPATAHGAITTSKYRHLQVREPSLNSRERMSQEEFSMFSSMVKEGSKEFADNSAGRNVTYAISDE